MSQYDRCRLPGPTTGPAGAVARSRDARGSARSWKAPDRRSETGGAERVTEGSLSILEHESETASPVIGYVVVTFDYDLAFGGRDAFVTELHVAPDVRRRGFGLALLQAAEREAHRLDVRALHLLVAPGNEVAERLYRRIGSVASPRTLMTKTLT